MDVIAIRAALRASWPLLDELGTAAALDRAQAHMRSELRLMADLHLHDAVPPQASLHLLTR